MTVSSFAKESGFNCVCMPTPHRTINGAYVGDLLSWVMGKAEPDNVWITIMSNLNIVAVSTLVDVACVVLAENVTLDEGVLDIAKAKGVNVFSTSLSSYEAAIKISGIIS